MKRLKCWRCWIEGERNTKAEFVTAGESRCLYHAGLHYLASINIDLGDKNVGYYVDADGKFKDTSEQRQAAEDGFAPPKVPHAEWVEAEEMTEDEQEAEARWARTHPNG